MTTVDLSEYDVPGRGRGVLDVIRWRYLLRLLVRKGTATRYRHSALGWTWSYVKPLTQFLVYWLVMGFIFGMNRGVENFPANLFAGFVAVTFFNEAFGNATTAIVYNLALVKKIYLPRELFPISAVIVAFVHFLPQLVILLVVVLVYGWIPTFAGIGAILLGVLVLAAAALGLGLFFAGLNVRFRDAQNFVEILRMLSTWFSPVLYTWTFVAERLPEWVLYLYMVNPITIAVELFHYGFWAPTAGDAWHGFAPHFRLYILASIAICIVFLIIGQATFRRFERTFAQDL